MGCLNHTSADRFILLGLSDVPYFQIICFFLFLVMYIFTLLGNLILILVVRITPCLQTPMYFFLSNLSVIDLGFSSTVIPNLLVNALSKDKSISLFGCAVQMFFYLALGATECILLAVMAYDRFAAICRPLHYHTIMNRKLCLCLAAGSWSFSCSNSIIHVILTFYMPYFQSNYINHFFCEIPLFLQISCRDTRHHVVLVYVSTIIIVLCSFLLTAMSYFYIVSAVLKIHSSPGRWKGFSTCGSHLTVVTLYYGTIMFMYMRPPSAHSPETDKTVAILYTAVSPMLNPFIYSIRNKDVKGTVKNNCRFH